MTTAAHYPGVRILIVDDQDTNVLLLQAVLTEHGYTDLVSTTDSRQALSLFLEQQPDLVLLDLQMPELDGFAVLDQLAPSIPPDTYLPILILTAEVGSAAKRRALAAGAKDFLSKPFDVTEVMLRIRNLLDTRLLHLQLRQQNDDLEMRVRTRTQELELSQVEIAERLARAADYRDDVTGQHIRRVGHGAALVARALGWPDAEVELIRQAAPLHDVGKIGIPDNILLKPGKLTPDEYERMKDHTTIGARLLAGSHSPVLQMAEKIALMHHERWDGSGYIGLSGSAIPIVARVTSVVDVFDALTHRRSYKEAWPVEVALAEIQRQSGRHFDPEIVEAFLSVLRQHDLAGAEGHEQPIRLG
jgi:putative two-component system response regulator